MNDQPACTTADQRQCDSDERGWTDLDTLHPAENRKVGGSIPSLPTRFAQASELLAAGNDTTVTGRPVSPSREATLHAVWHLLSASVTLTTAGLALATTETQSDDSGAKPGNGDVGLVVVVGSGGAGERVVVLNVLTVEAVADVFGTTTSRLSQWSRQSRVHVR